MLFILALLLGVFGTVAMPSVAAAAPSVAVATAAPSVAAVPSPCPSQPAAGAQAPSARSKSGAASASGPAIAPGATPVPCATPGLRTIGQTVAVGRKADLIGKAVAASQGTIGQEQIATRPVLRPGEVLEAIPGLVISQHSGEGKANQYYLRGFQLDHGTNLESTVFGIPVNLPTHAHGQGYSDLNYLIPELVSYVEFKKGTYYADQGDFSTAGAYNLFYRNTIAPVTEFGVGDYGYERFLTTASPKVGAGNLLYALEIYHNNGSFQKYGEYHKVNAVLRYTQTKGRNDFAVTGIAYNGPFNSSDQIPQRLVEAGAVGRYGYVDPTDGGNTYRYALSTQFVHNDERGSTKFNAYGVKSFLDLFSNFTYNYFDANDYYNVTANPVTCNVAYVGCSPNPPSSHSSNYSSFCPANNSAPAGAAPHSVTPAPYSFACGDQREQVDDRVYAGFDLRRSLKTPAVETTVGVGLRNDNIATVGLFLDNARVRYPDGTLSDDHVVERSEYAYAQSDIHVGQRLRLTPGVRFDYFSMNVDAFDPANSGSATAGLVDPKFALAYKFSPEKEFYADFGESYHSNDARGVIGINDPQTHRPFDPTGAPVQFNSPLTRGSGYEFGYRYTVPKQTTTISYYSLLLANELIFDGDHGTTSLGGPTLRRGIEVTSFYTPTNWLTLDADVASATARFIADPTHQGTGVPESLNAVISAGITVDKPHYAASLRVRYFGPRQLDTAGDAVSPETTTLNSQLTAKMGQGTRISLDIFNILNFAGPDVTYYYNSWTPYDAANPALARDPSVNPALGGAGVNDYHFHPTEKRTVRLTVGTQL